MIITSVYRCTVAKQARPMTKQCRWSQNVLLCAYSNYSYSHNNFKLLYHIGLKTWNGLGKVKSLEILGKQSFSGHTNSLSPPGVPSTDLFDNPIIHFEPQKNKKIMHIPFWPCLKGCFSRQLARLTGQAHVSLLPDLSKWQSTLLTSDSAINHWDHRRGIPEVKHHFENIHWKVH